MVMQNQNPVALGNTLQMFAPVDARPAIQPPNFGDEFRYRQQQALGQALMENSGSGPVRTPWEGVGRLSKTIAGTYLAKKGAEMEADAKREQAKYLGELLQGKAGDPKTVATTLIESGNPEWMSMGLTLLGKEKDKASFKTLSEDDEKALGLDTSGTYQQGDTGKIETVIAPTKPVSKVRLMTAEEKKGAGLPLNSSFSIDDASGEIKTVYKPDHAASDQTKPPAGYMWTPQGTLAAIPGGPADKSAEQADRQAQVEGAVASYDSAIDTIDRLKASPGFEAAVGVKNIFTGNPFGPGALPGTERANFEANLDTFKSQVFLPMVQQLRGMGQLSNAEGMKLTEAVGALNTNMTEDGFKASLDQIKKDLIAAKERTAKRATTKGAAEPAAAPQAVSTGGRPQVKTDEDYDALPSGTDFIDPDGKPRRKP